MLKITYDFEELNEFLEKLNTFTVKKREEFIKSVAKTLAARLISKVKTRTPVDTGTLIRGWTAETHEEAASGTGRGKNAIHYAAKLPIIKRGNVYEIEIINPVEYASFVEFGHRQQPGRYVPAIKKRLVRDFVEGKFFLEKSASELESETPAIIEEKLIRELDKIFEK